MASELVMNAARFAALAHAKAIQPDGSIGQLRKRSGEPYIVHPTAVAKMVALYGGTDEMIAAAYMHDVIEDCGVSAETLAEDFDETVVGYVVDLTDVTKAGIDGNRATRMAIEKARIAKTSPEVKTIKLADLIDNTADISVNDLKFAKTYMVEKMHALPILKEGNADLYSRAAAQVIHYFNTHTDQLTDEVADFIRYKL